MGWLIIIVLVVIVVYGIQKNNEKEAEAIRTAAKKKAEREKKEYHENVRNYYPNAYEKYWVEKSAEQYSYSKWAVWEREIIEQREKEKKEKRDKERAWEEKQSKFISEVKSAANKICPNLSNSMYVYRINTKAGICVNMKILQFFVNGVCLENDLDYTYNQDIYYNNKKLPSKKESGAYISESQEKQILDIIANIRNLFPKGKVVVLFNDKIEGWTPKVLFHSYQGFKWRIPEGIGSIDNSADKISGYQVKSSIVQLSQESPDCVIVIDAYTTNAQLKNNCENIFSFLQKKRPVVAYFSIFKNYDRSEMEEMIEQSRTEYEGNKLTEREYENLKEQAKALFAEKVKSWSPLFNHFYYTWLLYYYPTTCEFEANEQEWQDRNTVWTFKHNPEKKNDEGEYYDVIQDVVFRIKQKLIDTFGQEYLQFLTFVCLPASTQAKNEARYKEFSELLCKETGMENGYFHIRYEQDGLSKNDPANTTGKSIMPKISVDDWFEGKNVLLFDDVITKGLTMLKYKLLLEIKGATVIGGICIGKTKHERPI